MDSFKNLFKRVKIPKSKIAWWVKITTDKPKCIYFFGPFDSSSEAQLSQQGYIDDLTGENAIGIRVAIQQCEPTELTISDEEYF